MHAPGLSRSSPNRALIRRPWMPPEPSYLVGGYGEIENEIDNLDNLGPPLQESLCTLVCMGWNPRDMCSRTRDFRPRDRLCRGLARHRQALPLAPTPGAHRTRAARTLSLTHLLACHGIPFARCFPCRLRSNDPSAWQGVGLLGHEQIRFP